MMPSNNGESDDYKRRRLNTGFSKPPPTLESSTADCPKSSPRLSDVQPSRYGDCSGEKQLHHENPIDTRDSSKSPATESAEYTNRPPELSQLVCFGGLYEFVAQPLRQCEVQTVALEWKDLKTLKAFESDDEFTLSTRDFSILHTLSSEANATFDITAQLCFSRDSSSICHRVEPENGTYKLAVNIYGPSSNADCVGTFLQKCNLYIQRPEACSRNVIYLNPHCIPTLDDTPLMTSVFDLSVDHQVQNKSPEAGDFWTELGNDEPFAEEAQPALMKTMLHSHQLQALTFLLGREQGWDFSASRKDVWKSYSDRFGRFRYQNTLSGLSQSNRPPEFRGGILADDMGLGKTVSILALISITSSLAQCGCEHRERATEPRFAKGTIIVVPLSLLVVWESQIREHMSGSLRTLVYYGQARRRYANKLGQYDIVITTYNVVSSDWKEKGPSSISKAAGIFSYNWHRIVLDEAHMIREKNTQNARAVCAVDGIHRWCITGTPLHNRVRDISSLLYFLRAHPYDDLRMVEKEIIQPWRMGTDEKPLQRLRSLMKMLALHRSKEIIDLPPRIEKIVEVEFKEHELERYEDVRMGTIRVINKAITDGSKSGSTYLNAFQKINELRYICNHGTWQLKRSTHTVGSTLNVGGFSFSTLEKRVESLLETSDQACFICGTDMSEDCEESQQTLQDPRDEIDRICQTCLKEQNITGSSQDSLQSPGLSADESNVDTQVSKLPSKIDAVIKHLGTIPREDKSVIFSYWTSTLDVVQHGLDTAGIPYCRYDGRLRYAQRTEALRTFQIDSKTKVILVSITCGGQGLDLTVANHAILIEPQWNPMLEEQAVARIYRLGQKKGVYITRFVIKESFEQKIVGKQERKRVLSNLVLGKDNLKRGDAGRRQLLQLMDLVR
ncbi:hypothetical protein HD806DRAFT_516155 [Xylariaceae sp. AK1471]|nr:hypothetical protein HD806DRAFT_516155 [Xylariaceae sp. AK1471]